MQLDQLCLDREKWKNLGLGEGLSPVVEAIGWSWWCISRTGGFTRRGILGTKFGYFVPISS